MRCTLPNRSRALSPLLPALLLAAPVLRAQMRLSASQTNVESGRSLTLQAHPAAAGTNPDWEWTVASGGGLILPGEHGKATFVAPETKGEPVLVRVRVTDRAHPGTAAEFRIVVRPIIPGFPAHLADVVLPAVLGQDYLFSVPYLSRLTADPKAVGLAQPPFRSIRQIEYVEPGTGLGALDGCWLLIDEVDRHHRTFKAISPLGQPVPVPAWSNDVTSFALRPRNSQPGNPHLLVFSEQRRWGEYSIIRSVETDGNVRTLVGKPDAKATGTIPPGDGQGEEPRIGSVHDLTMDPDGNVFFGDRMSSYSGQMIRRLDSKGEVSLWAGRPDLPPRPADQSLVDGPANQTRFAALTALVQDPETGDLLVCDRSAVRRLHLAEDGLRIETVVGGPFRATVLPDRPQVPSPGESCLRNPYTLRIHGRFLLIGDEGFSAVLVYNLDTRILETLVGSKGTKDWREGPLQLFCRRPPSECAWIGRDLAGLAVSMDGRCVLASRQAVYEMNLATVFPGPVLRGRSGRDDASSSTTSGPAEDSSSSTSTTTPPPPPPQGHASD
jgi:hypothetical protein